MKIYVSHLRDYDFENELYKPIRESVLNTQHEFILPHKGGQTVNSKELIKSTDLILAEVSFPSTGQGIELGWASMLDIPIVCISKEGNKIAGSLKYITNRFATYTDSKNLVEVVSEIITK